MPRCIPSRLGHRHACEQEDRQQRLEETHEDAERDHGSKLVPVATAQIAVRCGENKVERRSAPAV